MAFTRVSCGVYSFNGTRYVAVDCGGGGNCLFLSIAWLLRRYNIDTATTHSTLRQNASARLDHWVQNPLSADHPNPLHVAMPMSRAAAQRLGVAGVWGVFCCIAAIVELYFTGGIDIQVEVLSLNALECKTYRSIRAAAPNPQHTIHLLYSGRVHYQALILQGTAGNVPPRQVVANYGGDAKKVLPRQLKRKRLNEDKNFTKKQKILVTKLLDTIPEEDEGEGEEIVSEKKIKSKSLGTVDVSKSMPDGTLEIHQIDVGQGDAALVLIKDDQGDIAFSILIDAGRSGREVTAYFDKLIKENNFRRVDMFFASHYDSDHIGGAPLVLDDETYTSESVILYDIGDPPDGGDQDYTDYMKCSRHDRRKLPDLHRPLVDLYGVTLTCLTFNQLTPVLDQEEDLEDMDSEETKPGGEGTSGTGLGDEEDWSRSGTIKAFILKWSG